MQANQWATRRKKHSRRMSIAAPYSRYLERKKNNLGNMYAKALAMDRDIGSLEIEEYKDEEKHGLGLYIWPDGRKYEGGW